MNPDLYCVWHPELCDRENCCMDQMRPGQISKPPRTHSDRMTIRALVILTALLSTALVWALI